MVITALCELEKNHGNLDKLGIDISKKKKVQIESENNDINRAIGSTAKLFGVNYSALKYRLQSLKVLEKQTATEEYIV